MHGDAWQSRARKRPRPGGRTERLIAAASASPVTFAMNHIYRLVWNRFSQQWVAAAETARGSRSRGGTVDGRPVAPARALLALCVALALGGTAWAAPQGGQVVSGSGSIGQAGATTTIQQDSNRLSLDWQSFNVGAGETVNFIQPNAQAIAVNRVLGTSGSEILGRLQSTGQVWLLNPNGILFGQNAQVNVGGLVASTLLAPDAQIGTTTTRFSAVAGKAGASVVNLGTIQAADGGHVALLGHTVSNQGSIVAPKGTVALGAGSAATLTFADNQLVKLQIDQGTLNDLVENRQLVQADGGRVFMSAGARDSVLASVVNNSGVVQARTVQNRAGTIVLLGGMEGGTTAVSGTLDASAPDGGNGGFIETSAHTVNVAPGAVLTTKAASGNAGTWLIDPADYTIAASGGNQTPTQLAAALAAGNVTIASSGGSNAATGAGSIFVNGDVAWGSANTLTLNAANNVEVNAVLAATGNGGLTINTASALSGGSPVAGGRLNVNMTNGGRVDLGAASALTINGNAYTVVTSNAALATVPDTGFFALGANLSGTDLPDIGIGDDNVFKGTFNGLGHTVNATGNANRQAFMFYAIGRTGVVENLAIINAWVRGRGRPDIGILASTSAGQVRNVSTSGTVDGGTSTLSAGGLVAVNNGSIVQSSSSADVIST
ncbi:MAG: filamentous hemagglutinin N-terminal domain-containing protein, partial [Comamonadaceae bacterium]